MDSFQQTQTLPWFVVALCFFTPLIGGIIWYFYKTRYTKYWYKGIVPPKMKFNQDNLLEVYLSLAAALMILEPRESKGKAKYINEYFNQYFKHSNYDFGDSLIFGMHHPIKIKTAAEWLKNHLNTEGEKAQVIYFLAGIAVKDGKFRPDELKFITLLNELLELGENNLRRVLAIYENYSKEKAKPKKSSNNLSSIQRALTILSLQAHPSKEEIKKSYRKLVKIHHPDMFSNASDAQKRMAEDKFRQIQEAYELLLSV